MEKDGVVVERCTHEGRAGANHHDGVRTIMQRHQPPQLDPKQPLHCINSQCIRWYLRLELTLAVIPGFRGFQAMGYETVGLKLVGVYNRV